jgi:hypothetical protein
MRICPGECKGVEQCPVIKSLVTAPCLSGSMDGLPERHRPEERLAVSFPNALKQLCALCELCVRPPLQKPGKLANSIFFRTQHSLPRALTATNEFANRGKLTGKVANSFWQRDALLYSISFNAAHGLPRTNADKRKAVRLLLADAEWGQWSHRSLGVAR